MIMKRNNLDILFQQYYERLVLFAESYVGDMMIAEDIVQDIVQDVFLTILSRPDFADVGCRSSQIGNEATFLFFVSF